MSHCHHTQTGAIFVLPAPKSHCLWISLPPNNDENEQANGLLLSLWILLVLHPTITLSWQQRMKELVLCPSTSCHCPLMLTRMSWFPPPPPSCNRNEIRWICIGEGEGTTTMPSRWEQVALYIVSLHLSPPCPHDRNESLLSSSVSIYNHHHNFMVNSHSVLHSLSLPIHHSATATPSWQKCKWPLPHPFAFTSLTTFTLSASVILISGPPPCTFALPSPPTAPALIFNLFPSAILHQEEACLLVLIVVIYTRFKLLNKFFAYKKRPQILPCISNGPHCKLYM